MDRKLAEQIANFRYRLISSIVSRDNLNHGETSCLIQEAAKKTYQIPGSRRTRVSTRSIERYLNQYRQGGFEALMPQSTAPKPGQIPKEYLDLAIALKQENPKRSVLQIIETLELSGHVPKGVLKRSTVYEHFTRQGLTRQQGRNDSKAYQRFTPKHRNVRWQGDTCHLLHIKDPHNPKRKKKLYLIAWLDEKTRIIPHAQLYLEEKSYALEDSLKKAILKFGMPEHLYADNGSIYSSNHLQSVCGRLGIHLSHTRPYKPQGRGKCERFFQTVRRSFLPELEVLLKEQDLSVQQINDYFFVWLQQHYHEQVHSATKQKPMLAFETDEHPLRRVALETLVEAFLVEESRLVDKTGVFSLNGVDYQAPLELCKTKIAVRYDPFDPETVQVYSQGVRFSDAYPLEIPEHVEHKEPAAQEIQPATGINYLQLLEQKSQKGLTYADGKEGP